MALMALILPFAAALASLALNRLVATRWTALGGAMLSVLSALFLFAEYGSRQSPRVLFEHVWLAWGDGAIRLTLMLDGLGWLLALLVYSIGALALVSAALAIPAGLRGFGGLFAALEIGLGVVAAGSMGVAPILLPAIVTLAGAAWFGALRSSGALAESDAPLIMGLAGVSGALALLAAALLALLPEIPPAALAFIVACLVMAAVILGGIAPLHGVMGAAGQAPVVLAAFTPLGLPLVGVIALLRLLPAYLALLNPEQRHGLIVIGLLGLFGVAARAIQARNLRQIVLAQLSAQLALLIVCAGCGEELFQRVAPGLALNAIVSGVALLLGVVALEQRFGTDELPDMIIRPGGMSWVSGVGMFVAAASMLGIPGAWGMWPKLWLFDALQTTAPWAIAPLLAAHGLLALALVAPIVAFWRAAAISPAVHVRETLPVIAAAPLILMGAAPNWAWDGLFAATLATAPALPTLAGRIAAVAAALLLLGGPFLVQRARKRRAPAADERLDGVLIPDSFGAALGGLAWLSAPIFPQTMHAILGQIGPLARRGLVILGRRFYLAAVVIALIVTILIFAAG